MQPANAAPYQTVDHPTERERDRQKARQTGEREMGERASDGQCERGGGQGGKESERDRKDRQ